MSRADLAARMRAILLDLYGAEAGAGAYTRLGELLDRYAPRLAGMPHPPALTQRDAILITYGDQIRQPGEAPLRTLADFCAGRLAGLVSGVHVLPFFPYSSDDGFSVIDYRQVDPQLGDWSDVSRLGRDFRLMADAVLNHVSSRSAWFQGFLQDDPRYRDYFIGVPPGTDLSQVVRPRALPLTTVFETAAGRKAVWTTFSDDQIDLNFANPEVLLEMVDVILGYVEHGAQILRLDAIAYLWKQPGTTCIHLPQTHQVVRLLRAALESVAPGVLLITETNVPHAENISYFGNGDDEAHLVYNFALPPLALHTFISGSAEALSGWAAGLSLPSRQTAFFNFMASHDGVGVNPARGILSLAQIDALVAAVQARGGLVSRKNNPDGTTSPYELNVNYYDALNDPSAGEPLDLQVARFIASQAILLSLAGLPGIYAHSLLGSRGWPQGVQQTGANRSINREKLLLSQLTAELDEPGSRRQRVFQRYAALLRARASAPAFDPAGGQRVLAAGSAVFALLRTPVAGGNPALCLHNITAQDTQAQLDLGADGPASGRWRDLVDGGNVELGRTGRVDLRPYQVLWLEAA